MKNTISEKKQERIKRRVIKGCTKAARRQKLDTSDLDQLRCVRVQMMPPVLRVILAVIGLGIWVIPFTGLLSLWWIIACIPIGLVFVVIAINGRKNKSIRRSEILVLILLASYW